MRLMTMGKIASVILGLCALRVTGYTPEECTLNHASSDPKEADVIAIGRVVGINRIVEKTRYSYEITFSIGRKLKGEVQKELKFIDGVYEQLVEDNTKPTTAGVGFTMSQMVQINGVYLIYFSKEGDRFRPRSYHYSICPIQEFVSENHNNEKSMIGLLEPIGLSEFKKWYDLESYLKEKGLKK